jgi:hypothetical protein
VHDLGGGVGVACILDPAGRCTSSSGPSYVLLGPRAGGLGLPRPSGPLAASYGVCAVPAVHYVTSVAAAGRDPVPPASRVDEEAPLRTRQSTNRPEIRFRVLPIDGTLQLRLARSSDARTHFRAVRWAGVLGTPARKSQT